jgi:hypothetical protein
MKTKNYSLLATVILLLLIAFTSCQKSDNDSLETTLTKATVPSGSALIVDKNFQQSGGWPSISTALIGYSSKTDSCGTDHLISNDSLYKWVETYYNGVNNDTVMITYKDAAINTGCELGSGIATSGETITKGYVLFNTKAARSGAATPSMSLSKMAYVSTLQFTLTATSLNGAGITLYKSSDGVTYTKVSTYKPTSTTTGSFFSVAINEANVYLKFASEDSKNEYFRIHDLKVWSKGVSDGSVLYVNDNFQKWALKGYVLPVPGVAANKTGTQYIPLAWSNTVEYDTTITYYSGTPVKYVIHDGAVNPDCYNHHGDVSLVYGLTTGYLEMPLTKSGYANTNVNASITVSAVPSVSLIEFWIAVTGMSGHYQLYKSVNGGDYTLYKDIIVKQYAGIGKYFRFYVNEKNVSFKFTTYTGTGAYTTTPKLFGLRIWSDGKP